MAATALIKFTQGPNTAAAGVAVKGTAFSVDGSVTVTNGNNADVASWLILLLDAPPESANYPIGTNPRVLASASTSTPTATFDPDVPGGYRVLLDVLDSAAKRDRDIRDFGVPNARGIIIPPYQKNPDPLPLTLPTVVPNFVSPAEKPDEQNYGSQARGWTGSRLDGQVEQFLRSTGLSFLPIFNNVASTTATGYQRIASFELDGAVISGMGLTLQVILESSDAAATAEFRLFNLTDSVAVPNSSLSTTATVSTLLTATLTGGTDLPAGSKIYEAQIRRTGGAMSDAATCTMVRF